MSNDYATIVPTPLFYEVTIWTKLKDYAVGVTSLLSRLLSKDDGRGAFLGSEPVGNGKGVEDFRSSVERLIVHCSNPAFLRGDSSCDVERLRATCHLSPVPIIFAR